MKTVEIIGFKRASLTRSQLAEMRYSGNIPCILYGGGVNVQFHSPAALFRDLIYTPEAKFVELNIEGTIYKAIKQEVQFHPVNDMVLHVDFLLLEDNKEVKMNIPLRLTGTAAGVLKGGKMVQRMKHVPVKALPKNMPEVIELDVTNLEVGKSIRISDIKTVNFEVLKAPAIPLAGVETTRAMKDTADAAAAAGKK